MWALKLGAPTTVESRTTLDGSVLEGDKPNFETYPIAAIIYFDFPARDNLPAVKMTWYDGGLMPPAPAELPSGQRLPDNGVLYIGSQGKMYHSPHGGMPQLLPASLIEEAKAVPVTMERSPGHYEEWVEGCRGGKRPAAGFDYSGPLTETILLGVLSLRAPGSRLESGDRTVRIWYSSTGKEIFTLNGDKAAFSPDGKHVLTVQENMVRIWPVEPLDAAKRLKPRDLTPEEQERFEIRSEGEK